MSCFTILTVLFIPMVGKIANHIGALDIPNERKVHKEPMPRLGGLAIIAGFVVSITYLLIPFQILNW